MMKLLTLYKGKALACLALMCLFLAQSCRKDNLMPNSKDLQNGISLAEAKAYFDAHLKKDTKPEKLMSNSVQHSINIQDFLNNKQPIWDKAFHKVISTGTAVNIPLDFGSARIVVNKKTKATVPFNSLNYLLMYKDSLQKIHAEWVELNPDSSWLYGNRSSYTGSITVKDWDGKPIKKFDCNKPKPISSAVKSNMVSSLTSVQPNRIQNQPSVVLVEKCVRIKLDRPCSCLDRSKCDYCLADCALELCWDEPECISCVNQPNPSGGTSGEGNATGGSGSSTGGGSLNPNNYIPGKCDPSPNYVPIQFPDGTSTIPACVPIPYEPPPIAQPIGVQQALKTGLNIQPYEIELNNFIDNPSNLDKVNTLSIYFAQNGGATSVGNIEFLRWAIGYLIENPSKFNQAFKDLFNGIFNEYSPIYIPTDFDVAYEQQWYNDEDELAVIGEEILLQGVGDTDPIPESYYIKGTGIDMNPAAPRNGTTVHGNPRNAKYFWDQLIKKRPEMFSADNRSAIARNDFKSVMVDGQWVKYNPTHKAYIKNQLVHHHHKQRNIAFAIPAKVHQKWTAILHRIRANGKILRLRGSLNTIDGFLQVFSILTDIRTGNPDAWVNGFGSTNEIGKLYKDQINGYYFEITDQTIQKNSSGTVVRAIVTYDAFEDYIWDEDEKRYMGVLKIGTYVEDIDTVNHRSTSLTRQ